ncbi:MAG TPA: hypothetical protein VIX14_03130 [Terriglobales bacterium]
MATIWKSTDQKSTNQATNHTISGTLLSSWSRQQKLALIACFTLLGLLLAMSACSEQPSKPALVSVSRDPSAQTAPVSAGTTAQANTTVPLAAAKKSPRKRPANVTYSDANSGVSFLYPRKFVLLSGDDARPQFAGLGDAWMNFVQPGGVAVATVVVPDGSYPGTDFASAFFNVNVNRSLSEQECAHFALADSHNVNGGSADSQKVKVGSTDMDTTSNFSASALTQTETQYYHSFGNGACYEYILSLGTAGYGIKDGAEPVNRDAVFARLEKILTTVKIKTAPVEQEHQAEPAGASIAGGKE